MVPGKRKIHPGLGLAVVFGLFFAVLMAARLGLFHRTPAAVPAAADAVAQRDTWMAIYQKDRRIGRSHRRLARTENGFSLTDDTLMRINTMGMIQDLNLRTRASLRTDLSLSDFDFDLASSLFSFQVRGEIDGDTLWVDMQGQRTSIPLKAPLYLSGGILDAAAASDMTPGQSRVFSVFDPATLGRRPARITLKGPETIEIDGKKVRARRFDVDFMGSAQSAWIDDAGEVVREKGFMGITMVRVSRESALGGPALDASQDLTRLAAVTVDRKIPAPETLTRLRIHVDGIADPLALDGGRQHFDGGKLSVRRETVPDPDRIAGENLEAYLAPSAFIESDHPRIRQTVAGIVDPADRPLVRVRKIMDWIHENIERRPVLSVPGALQTLTHRMGDCNEHAVLFAALARAAGVPTRVEAGLVYLRGKFYYHAWNSLFLGRWVTADALMHQLPADVTHIRFVQGAADRQIDLMQVIGRIRFSQLETADD